MHARLSFRQCPRLVEDHAEGRRAQLAVQPVRARLGHVVENRLQPGFGLSPLRNAAELGDLRLRWLWCHRLRRCGCAAPCRSATLAVERAPRFHRSRRFRDERGERARGRSATGPPHATPGASYLQRASALHEDSQTRCHASGDHDRSWGRKPHRARTRHKETRQPEFQREKEVRRVPQQRLVR